MPMCTNVQLGSATARIPSSSAASMAVQKLCERSRTACSSGSPAFFLTGLIHIYLHSGLVMDLHAVKHLCKRRVIMVYDLTVPQIQVGDLCHFFLTECEIPDVHVLLHAVFVDRFRDDDHASLYIPSQSNLRRALSIFSADLSQDRMGEDPMTAGVTSTVSQRSARRAG